MRLGKLEIENQVFLAPMAGVTDQPFRIMCKEHGCGFMYTEMISAKGLFYNNANTNELLSISPFERPAAVQLFGSSPELLAAMAAKLDELPIDVIDINMGCPAPKIVKNGEGSFLMTNPALVGRIVRAVSAATHKPVTVKIRKGFDAKHVNAVEVAEVAQNNGAAAVAVHGRTREQYYSGAADWEIIARVKERLSIPVIGNGDVSSPEDVKKMLEYTGCDAVMIGRGAQGNPWIFSRSADYLRTGVIPPPPDSEERISVALRHAALLAEHKGARLAMLEMRKHFSWYIKGMPGATEARAMINTARSIEEMKEILYNQCKVFLPEGSG